VWIEAAFCNEWRTKCADASGRSREMLVRARNGALSIIAPPGEAGILTPYEAAEFCRVVTEAANLCRPAVVCP
jgi:hypothetical protein